MKHKYNEMTDSEILDIIGSIGENGRIIHNWEKVEYSQDLNIPEILFNEMKNLPKIVNVTFDRSFLKSLRSFSEKNKKSVCERIKFVLLLISRKRVTDPRFSEKNNSPYRVHDTVSSGENMTVIDVANRKYVLRFPISEKNSNEVHVKDIASHASRNY